MNKTWLCKTRNAPANVDVHEKYGMYTMILVSFVYWGNIKNNFKLDSFEK
jgi:hypothetical protein